MSKFKIGDVVRIIGDSIGYSENFVGKEYAVLEAENGLYSLRVYYNGGLPCVLKFWEKDLEIVKTHYDSAPLQQAMQGWSNTEASTGKISSNGGSSDYYKLDINGNSVQVEDVIYAMVGGDFALGNAVKALRRMYLDSIGAGKQGVDMSYDANKISYFVNSFVKRFGEAGAKEANNAN